MNLSKLSLLVLSLVAMLGVACGEEPADTFDAGPNNNGTDGTGTDTTPDITVDSSPIASLSSLVDKTYILDFAADYWIKPVGEAGTELGKYTPKFTMQIRTVDEAARSFTALLGTTKNGAQDTCNQTYTLNGTFGPANVATTFMTQPTEIKAIIEGPDVSLLATMRNFTLKGEFYNQGAGYKSGGLTAELDGGEIFSLFTLMNPVPTSATELCGNLLTLGADCEACSQNPGVAECVTVDAQLFKINETAGLTLQDVAAPNQSGTCL